MQGPNVMSHHICPLVSKCYLIAKGKSFVTDPSAERFLFLFLEDLVKSSIFMAQSKTTDIFSLDEFSFTSKLLPYVVKLFQENYKSGWMAMNSATFNVFLQDEDGEYYIPKNSILLYSYNSDLNLFQAVL